MLKKTIVITIMCLFFAVKIIAQEETSVEKSIWGIQVGIPIISGSQVSKLHDNSRDILSNNPTNGFMLFNELKLANKIVLKTEAGLGGYFGIYKHVRLLLTPTIAIEPRWYFNTIKYQQCNNTGSFIGLNINYNPNLFNLRVNWDNAVTCSAVSIAPVYAFKKPIGKYFHYEVGGGIGYRWCLEKVPYEINTGDFHFIVQLRIGYSI